jgi:hypothetical protein
MATTIADQVYFLTQARPLNAIINQLISKNKES